MWITHLHYELIIGARWKKMIKTKVVHRLAFIPFGVPQALNGLADCCTLTCVSKRASRAFESSYGRQQLSKVTVGSEAPCQLTTQPRFFFLAADAGLASLNGFFLDTSRDTIITNKNKFFTLKF